MPPKERLNELMGLKIFITRKARGTTFEYDVWFNTNENVTIENGYTDFLGKGIYCRVNSKPINTRLFNQSYKMTLK